MYCDCVANQTHVSIIKHVYTYIFISRIHRWNDVSIGCGLGYVSKVNTHVGLAS